MLLGYSAKTSSGSLSGRPYFCPLRDSVRERRNNYLKWASDRRLGSFEGEYPPKGRVAHQPRPSLTWYKQIEFTPMIPADSSLAFWLACIAVGFAGAALIIWARHRGKQVWTRLGRRQRILVRCLALAGLWCMLALVEHDRLEASWMTAAVALFWGRLRSLFPNR